MGQFVQIVPIKFKSYPVTTAATVVLDTQAFPFPLTINALPGATGSMLVEYSCSPNAAGNVAGSTWMAWPSGTVTTNTTDVLIAPVSGLRFTAGTAAGVVEVNG